MKTTIAFAVCVFSFATLSMHGQQYLWTTLAGNIGGPGISDGTGPTAHFFEPGGTAVDGNGNVYVSDSGNNTIRKISNSAVVTTVAGRPGVTGSIDGLASSALFNSPSRVAVDPNGNILVSDFYNQTIRKIAPSGMVTTLAGSPGVIGSANGAGSAARFYYPQGISIDGSGNLYVADKYNHTIRRVTSAGAVTTLAGSAGSGRTHFTSYENGPSPPGVGLWLALTHQ